MKGSRAVSSEAINQLAPIADKPTFDKLSGAEREVLRCLFLHGPTFDGDLPSKAGRSDLFDKGLVTRAGGYNCLTEAGFRLGVEAGLTDVKEAVENAKRRDALNPLGAPVDPSLDLEWVDIDEIASGLSARARGFLGPYAVIPEGFEFALKAEAYSRMHSIVLHERMRANRDYSSLMPPMEHSNGP